VSVQLKEKIMRFLQHQEHTDSYLRPRHPFVAVHDIIVSVAAIFLVLVTDGWLQAYFVVVVAMFATSALHHSLSLREWHHRIDRSMIQIMIAGTPMPYTEVILENGYGLWFALLWAWAGLSVIIKLTSGYLIGEGLLPAFVYVVTGALAITVMFSIDMGSNNWTFLFWSGVALYFLQFLSYNLKWFDVFPGKFGYRESQHLILLLAVMCHTVAGIKYS